VIESGVVFGAIFVGGLQFYLKDATHAVATISIFLAASSRIAPAVLRIQQGALGIKGASGSATPTLDLIESLSNVETGVQTSDQLIHQHIDFPSEIFAQSIFFTYPQSTKPAINNISLRVKTGTSLAIVGSSGAGKTTLADLLLGVIEPDKGSVLIAGEPVSNIISKWPGAIAYVPQITVLSNRTIKENILAGYPVQSASDDFVFEALDKAQIGDFVRSLPNGLNTMVGENGTNLSGGQRQRIGIARALITNPRILVLDEATSSLDGITESEITKELMTLKGEITLLVIAHRLSTVKNADEIIYLKNGAIEARGNFETIRREVPNFETQARLAGM
jgi:ABC-type multidrug transport system fused ATPase/permease subunit